MPSSSASYRDSARYRKALELTLQKMLTKESLTEWCRTAGYEPAHHHRVLIEALEELEAGITDRLMVFMPPGSAKSTYVSVLFPPWFLARNATLNVMACSHTTPLAERFGRRVRNLVRAYPEELGIRLSEDNTAVGRWQLATRNGEGGEYLAAGAGQAIAGFRSDLTVIDDPIRGREEAESETQRKKLHDWWAFDVQPRLKPGGRVALVQTRWHEDDLAGWLLNEEGRLEEGGRWRVVSLPMEAEGRDDPLGRRPGERLWPEWFTPDMVATAKRDVRLWTSLYQQRPAPEEGSYWRRTWLRPVPRHQIPPRHLLRIYGGSDYAVTESDGDWTVHAVVGIDPDDRPWLLDLWREQASSDWWIEALCDLILEWKPLQWAEEQGQIKSALGPFIARETRRRKAWTDRQSFTPRADKPTTGRAMQAMVASNGLWYADDAPWRSALESELLAFPAGKHDDIHDALAKLGLLLDVALRGNDRKSSTGRGSSGYRSMGGTSGRSAKVA